MYSTASKCSIGTVLFGPLYEGALGVHNYANGHLHFIYKALGTRLIAFSYFFSICRTPMSPWAMSEPGRRVIVDYN